MSHHASIQNPLHKLRPMLAHVSAIATYCERLRTVAVATTKTPRVKRESFATHFGKLWKGDDATEALLTSEDPQSPFGKSNRLNPNDPPKKPETFQQKHAQKQTHRSSVVGVIPASLETIRPPVVSWHSVGCVGCGIRAESLETRNHHLRDSWTSVAWLDKGPSESVFCIHVFVDSKHTISHP